MSDQLKNQNNGTSWRDCEAAGLKHQLGPPEEVKSAYGSPVDPIVSTVRRCQRCPVSIMHVPKR